MWSKVWEFGRFESELNSLSKKKKIVATHPYPNTSVSPPTNMTPSPPPRVYLYPGEPDAGAAPRGNPGLSWVTAVLVVLSILSLTLALATVYVFAAMRRGGGARAAFYYDDDPAAGPVVRRPPRLVEGVLVSQPSGGLVAGVPAAATDECAI